MTEQNVPELIVMVGLAGSGKSTLAKQLAKEKNGVVVSSDALRKELFGDENCRENHAVVFEHFHKKVKVALKSGKSVIADATHLSMKARRGLLESVKGIPCIKTAYILSTPVEDCILQDGQRNRSIGAEEIQKQQGGFQVPFKEEGFDKIQIIGEPLQNARDFFAVLREMDQYDQHNPHHNATVGQHCALVFREFQKFGYEPAYEAGALLHDIGKLQTMSKGEDGIAHYYHHENVGAYQLLVKKEEWKKLTGLSEEEILKTAFLINYHMMPREIKKSKNPSKWESSFGKENLQLLMDFCECDMIRREENSRYSCVEEFAAYTKWKLI